MPVAIPTAANQMAIPLQACHRTEVPFGPMEIIRTMILADICRIAVTCSLTLNRGIFKSRPCTTALHRRLTDTTIDK
jgi:hypothetical protein